MTQRARTGTIEGAGRERSGEKGMAGTSFFMSPKAMLSTVLQCNGTLFTAKRGKVAVYQLGS